MQYPSFIAEVGLRENRGKLRFSVRSGLGIVLAFGVLTVLGMRSGLVPTSAIYIVPIALKLATNTFAWWTLRSERFVIEAASLNVMMDTVALTWAIYLTGGIESPMFAVYAIELTVVALLSNVGVTIIVMALALVMHGAMVWLVQLQMVPSFPPPALGPDVAGTWDVVVALIGFGFVLGLPTMFTASILADLRRKKRALEQRTIDLEQASQAKARFIANLTHELRTPIHGISGLAEVLEAGVYGPVTDKQRRAHAEVKRSARSLLALVDGLLALARSEDGRITPKLEPIDIREHVLASVEHVRNVVGLGTLTIETDVPEDVGAIVTDGAMLEHVLQNLVANAVKFTPDGGTVRVRARREEHVAVIDVEDTGIGIAAQDQERIFEPFAQVHDGSFVREHGGIGLGLALVRQLVGAVAGTIEVSSEVGRGSVFRVRIPSVRVASSAAA